MLPGILAACVVAQLLAGLALLLLLRRRGNPRGLHPAVAIPAIGARLAVIAWFAADALVLSGRDGYSLVAWILPAIYAALVFVSSLGALSVYWDCTPWPNLFGRSTRR